MLFARSCLGKRSSGKRWIHGRRSTAVSYPVTSLYSVALSSSSGDSCAFWWSSSHRDAGRPHLIRRRRCAGNFTWCATTYGRPCNPRGPETAGHWHLALSSYESAEKNIRGYCAKTTGKRDTVIIVGVRISVPLSAACLSLAISYGPLGHLLGCSSEPVRRAWRVRARERCSDRTPWCNMHGACKYICAGAHAPMYGCACSPNVRRRSLVFCLSLSAAERAACASEYLI